QDLAANLVTQDDGRTFGSRQPFVPPLHQGQGIRVCFQAPGAKAILVEVGPLLAFPSFKKIELNEDGQSIGQRVSRDIQVALKVAETPDAKEGLLMDQKAPRISYG